MNDDDAWELVNGIDLDCVSSSGNVVPQQLAQVEAVVVEGQAERTLPYLNRDQRQFRKW